MELFTRPKTMYGQLMNVPLTISGELSPENVARRAHIIAHYHQTNRLVRHTFNTDENPIYDQIIAAKEAANHFVLPSNPGERFAAGRTLVTARELLQPLLPNANRAFNALNTPLRYALATIQGNGLNNPLYLGYASTLREMITLQTTRKHVLKLLEEPTMIGDISTIFGENPQVDGTHSRAV